jgi:thiol-disulfide isomerase/thioredoxin
MMKMTFTSGLAALAVALALAGCKPSETPKTAEATGGAHEDWLTDFTAAMAAAKSGSKLMLADFTGSDWCPPCMSLAKNVFGTDEFKKFAKENLILLEVDFPRRKPISEEQKKANEALSEKFNIEGFPTVILFSPDGKELSRESGYGGEPVNDYINKIKGFAGK